LEFSGVGPELVPPLSHASGGVIHAVGHQIVLSTVAAIEVGKAVQQTIPEGVQQI
jgi:hypothetical protein